MTERYVDIPVPDDWQESLPALTWAKRNCPSYITNDAILINGVYHYRFYFGRVQDQFVFALRWS